jgi:hypothetical protein
MWISRNRAVVKFWSSSRVPRAVKALIAPRTAALAKQHSGKSSILHGLAVWEFCRTAIEMERGADVFLAGQAVKDSGWATMSSRRSTSQR